jgi:hypothetical protein
VRSLDLLNISASLAIKTKEIKHADLGIGLSRITFRLNYLKSAYQNKVTPALYVVVPHLVVKVSFTQTITTKPLNPEGFYVITVMSL